MPKKTFKDYMQSDIENSFFNTNEFAVTILVDDQEVDVIKDDDKLADYNSKLSEGLAKCELLFYAPISQFKNELFIEKRIMYRRKSYLIEQLFDDDGVYTILLVAMTQ